MTSHHASLDNTPFFDAKGWDPETPLDLAPANTSFQGTTVEYTRRTCLDAQRIASRNTIWETLPFVSNEHLRH